MADWSIDETIDETQFHIDALRAIIKGHQLAPRADKDIARTLNFALSNLRDRRANLHHVRARIDQTKKTA